MQHCSSSKASKRAVMSVPTSRALRWHCSRSTLGLGQLGPQALTPAHSSACCNPACHMCMHFSQQLLQQGQPSTQCMLFQAAHAGSALHCDKVKLRTIQTVCRITLHTIVSRDWVAMSHLQAWMCLIDCRPCEQRHTSCYCIAQKQCM